MKSADNGSLHVIKTLFVDQINESFEDITQLVFLSTCPYSQPYSTFEEVQGLWNYGGKS